MRNFLILLKTQMMVYYGISSMKYKYVTKKKDLWEIALAFIGVVIGGGSLLFLYTIYLTAMFTMGKAINQPDIMPTMVILISQLVTLIFGFLWIISLFYFSDDFSILVPLPIESYKIMFSKYLIVLLNEYITLIFLMGPAIIIYGIGTGANLLYYIISVIVFLFIPIIPLSISSIVSVTMMRFINFKRKKDLYTIIISTVILIFAIGIQFLANRAPSNGQEYINNILLQNINLAKIISRAFPPSFWSSYALTQYNNLYGILYLILFVGVSVLITIALIGISQKMYLKSVISGQEVYSKRKSININKKMKNLGVIKALMLREWKLFYRVPVYFMNVLPIAIIIPIIALINFFGKSGESFGGINELVKYTSDIRYTFIISLIALGLSIFVSGTNSISSTTFSREGEYIYISKLLPIVFDKHIKAKLYFGAIISGILLLPTYVISIIIFKFNFITLIISVILSITGIFLTNIMGIIVDAINPKLEWENPQKAMKGNLNVLFTMFASVILGGIIIGLAYFLTVLGLNIYITLFIDELIMLILIFVLYILSVKAVSKLYRGI